MACVHNEAAQKPMFWAASFHCKVLVRPCIIALIQRYFLSMASFIICSSTA